jgi:hypothetical protein
VAKTEPPQNIKPYDGMAKASFEQLAPQIIPCLIPEGRLPEGWTKQAILNVELNRNTIAIDFGSELLVESEADPVTLNTEMEVDPDELFLPRVCEYHINLYMKYRREVFSLVLLPFECEVPKPLRIVVAGHEFLRFDPIIICLWLKDPQGVLDRQEWAIYMFLPAMDHPSLEQMKQAVEELAARFALSDRQQFSDCVGWFLTMLERTTMVSDPDKQTMKEWIKMKYAIHPLMAENSTIKGIIDLESETKAEAKATARVAAVEERLREEAAVTLKQVKEEAERWAEQKLLEGLREADRQATLRIAEAKQEAAEKEAEAALAKQKLAEAEAALAKQQAALAQQHATEQAELARQQAVQEEIQSLKELILDLAKARFSVPLVLAVQQAMDLDQDVKQLKAFHHQLACAASEAEVTAWLGERFPVPIQAKTAAALENTKELILDFVSDHFAASTREAVQQRINPAQSVEQLKAFFRQLTRISDEQAIPALLDQFFPVS